MPTVQIIATDLNELLDSFVVDAAERRAGSSCARAMAAWPPHNVGAPGARSRLQRPPDRLQNVSGAAGIAWSLGLVPSLEVCQVACEGSQRGFTRLKKV
jgi:hypothetical protein